MTVRITKPFTKWAAIIVTLGAAAGVICKGSYLVLDSRYETRDENRAVHSEILDQANKHADDQFGQALSIQAQTAKRLDRIEQLQDQMLLISRDTYKIVRDRQ